MWDQLQDKTTEQQEILELNETLVELYKEMSNLRKEIISFAPYF